MTEVRFYHLTMTPLERTLPGLLAVSLNRGWRVLVQGAVQARLEFLDDLLWTHPEDGFLPHGLVGSGCELQHPILLGHAMENMNEANVLMLIDGALVNPKSMAGFDTVAVLFDGNDPNAVAQARKDWKAVAESEHEAVYWAQENQGSWVKKATA